MQQDVQENVFIHKCSKITRRWISNADPSGGGEQGNGSRVGEVMGAFSYTHYFLAPRLLLKLLYVFFLKHLVRLGLLVVILRILFGFSLYSILV